MSAQELSIKIVIIGNSGVGKSCLLVRFVDDRFATQTVTVNADIKSRRMTVDGKTVKLTIWDTAGQERLQSMPHSYYRGAHGVLLVYDVTERDSLANMDKWLTDVNNYATNTNIVKMLVGNKADEDNASVSKEEGCTYARRHNMLFFEASAKTGNMVDQVFEELVREIIDTRGLLDDEQKKENFRVNSDDNSNNTENTSCCNNFTIHLNPFKW